MTARWVLGVVAALQAWAAVPTPESHFGFKMGDDRKLVEWSKVVAYFDALQQSSDKIKVRILGRSTMGRPFIAAWISNPDTLANLAKYQEIQARLADPRRTPEAEAGRLAAEGKTVVLITCSIHSNEVASTLTAVQFAYRILTEDTTKFRAILDNTIFILVPSLNPDGVDIVRNWYNRTADTPFEGTSPPELYHKYVGHDNNRDWYIFSQIETRLTIDQLHNQWHPQIVYDVHQQGAYGARMFVPPWLDPIEPNVDPILAQLANMIGTGMAADLTSAGKKGISINSTYDFWTPARHYQAYHGGMRILSESASAKLASPITVASDEIRDAAPGYSPRQSSWNYLEPWLGGEWRLRDIIDYQQIAWESCLWQAAVRREDLLRSFYRIGQRAVARRTPTAFVIPKQQRDPAAARTLVNTLTFGLVEIEETANTYVIPMQQPYSSFAKTLLERQNYPDLRLYPGGPPKRPYDVTAHTLPLLMGVDVRPVESVPGTAKKRPARYVFQGPKPMSASNGDTWREINRIWRKGASVWRNPSSGDFSAKRVEGWVEKKRPRIGLYRSHMPIMDEGWTRWMLERFNWSYSPVTNSEIRTGALKDRFDVILFPDQGPSTIHNGLRPGSMPPEYVGGLAEEGANALLDFARAGGTLIFLNDSTSYAIGHLGIPLRNAVRGVPSRDFYCPGSLLNVSLDTTHALSKGLPQDLTVWFEESPAWEVPEGSPVKVIARYPEANLLASGWLLGERHLARRAALVEVPMEKGRAVLFGMRPQYRAQSYLTLKLLFNAFLL
ncbi:MAG: peptidase M14 [Bryobacterales bacterium]|nr:peptidase M14 [Bryobacterales bacterium]